MFDHGCEQHSKCAQDKVWVGSALRPLLGSPNVTPSPTWTWTWSLIPYLDLALHPISTCHGNVSNVWLLGRGLVSMAGLLLVNNVESLFPGVVPLSLGMLKSCCGSSLTQL